MSLTSTARLGDLFRSLRPSTLRTGNLNIRSVVFIVGKIALFAAVGFAFLIGDMFRNAQTELPSIKITPVDPQGLQKDPGSLANYQVILSTAIFGRLKPDASPAPKQTSANGLKIRLVAINELSGSSRLAILEDTTKQNQDVFELNDAVFGQGKLVGLERDSVKIEQNGQIYLIKLEDVVLPSSGTSSEPASGEQTDFSVAEDELTAALANLPQLLSQARAVPYFRNGQSIGMRLFAIRSGSMYEKLGLRNGDIILSVNENSLSDPAQALKLFEQLKNERSIGVRLERNGQGMDMKYNIR